MMWTSIIFSILLFSLCQTAPTNFYSTQFYPVKDSDPTKSEVKACGTIRDVIRRGTARFRKVLVRNDNNEMYFKDDNTRYMTSRAKSKLDVLASRVISTWGSGYKLYVEKSWTDNVDTSSQITRLSLHYEGRAIKVKVRSGNSEDRGKLARLCGLAVESGFDFVHFYRNDEIHISVKPDVCQTNVDLAFIMDASGSVGYYNYQKCKEFLKNLVDFYNVGPTQSHISLIRYASYITTMFKLNSFYTKWQIKSAIGSTSYTGGGTATGTALLELKNNVFSTSNGMRNDKTIPKIGILLTDGRSNQGYSVSAAAALLRQSGVSMFSIGIGNNLNMRELNDVASDPDSTHVYRLDGFDNLSEFVDQMSTVACDEGAKVSQCESAETLVEGGSFKYFRGQFGSDTYKVTIEVEDLIGKSYLYVSLTNKNPGPLDDSSTIKSQVSTSPRVITATLSSTKLVFISVQGQQDQNKFKINIWNSLFAKDKFPISVNENLGARSILNVRAQVQGTFKYSISHGNVGNAFRIDPNTGEVFTTKGLNREATAKYLLVIKAEDINQHCHQGRTSIEVTVKDKNDNNPRFTRDPFVASVREDSMLGYSVTRLTATDADVGVNAEIRYSFASGQAHADKFVINYRSGTVTLAKELDYDAQPNGYQFTVKATDGGQRSVTAQLKIHIIDVNEAPFFTNNCVRLPAGCNFNTEEGKNAGEFISTMSASDPDKTRTCTLHFSILSSDKEYFQIGETNGQIRTKKKIDRELKETYFLTIKVRDCDASPLSASTVVKVTATDINDNTPVFPVQQYTASVQENRNAMTQVIQVRATDSDKGNNAKITYRITNGATKNSFSIDPSSGNIVTKAKLDRESVVRHTLTVEARDGGSPAKSSTVAVIVNVLDVNDNNPEFLGGRSLSVTENVASGTNVATISTQDNDEGLNGKVRCNIIRGNVGLAFNMDPASCKLKTAGSIDREGVSSYTLQIEAADLGRPVLKTSAQFTVTVNDMNDNTPVFTSSVYTGRVKENAATNTNIVKVSATDKDTGLNAKITYTVVSGDASRKFAIDANSGQIKLIGVLDFGTTHLYDVRVEAKDGGSPTKRSTATVKIIVEDTNDFSPVFNPNRYSASIAENANAGFSVKTITATDRDSGPSGKISYSITNGNIRNSFKINSQTGLIQTTKKLDYETTSKYTLTVQAKDNGKPSRTGSATIVINIQDLNDNTPIFEQNPYRMDILENTVNGHVIGTVKANDADSGQNAALTYQSLTKGIPISVSSDGKVKVLGSLDREDKDRYIVNVKVIDGGNPRRESTSQVIVTVLDANDNPPVIKNAPITSQVIENSPQSTLVVFIVASDADIGNNAKLRYSLSPTSGSSFPFTIDSKTGKITTTSAGTLDRETTNQYKGTITVTDGGNPTKSISTTITIQIKDENDNKPSFTKSRYSFSITEEQNDNLNAGTVTATDQDIDENAKLKYSIIAGNTGNRFVINQNTGRIDARAKLDRETTAKYTLKIRVSDNGIPSHSAELFADISVKDINDNTPVMGQSSYSSSIREDAAPGSNIVQISAKDADEGVNANILYRITGGANNDSFQINSATGQLTTNSTLDYETTSSYQLEVVAEDGGTPKRTTQPVKVNIQVINVDDNAPEFGKVSEAKVSEGVSIGTPVVTLNATDKDGGTLRYEISQGNTNGAFDIDSSLGKLKTKSKLDRETTASYNLTVLVRDQANKATSVVLSVKILDINDNKPVFGKNTYKGNIVENGAQGQAVMNDAGTTALKVSATDNDEGVNAEIKYLIVSGNIANAFQLDANTGALTANRGLDREDIAIYNLVIAADDKGIPALRSTVKLQVNIIDQNDNSPSFEKAGYTTQILENSPPNFSVISIRANDPDEGNNGKVSLTILSENSGAVLNFKIDATSGVVQTLKKLDRENENYYHLRIQASDGAQSSKKVETDLNITVLDENDNSPSIVSPSTLNPVTEGISPGLEIAIFKAEDRDIGTNAAVTFTVISGNEGNDFDLNSNTGVFKLLKELDREVKSEYKIKIKVQDKGTPSYRSFREYVLNVTDVNDNAPQFSKRQYTGDVQEDAVVSTSILQVMATDADIGTNAILHYSIKNSNGFPFNVDSSNGKIKTSAKLDYEKMQKYDLVVIAGDGNHSTEVPVVINVININDNAPIFTAAKYIGNISESATPSSVILTVKASDPDPFGKISYSLINGTSVFRINRQTGELKTSASLDRETTEKYLVLVNATDGGRPTLSATAMVEIVVTDANDNAPRFRNKSTSVSVTENKPKNTFVAHVIAEDEDIGTNAQIQYEIKMNSGSTDFGINSRTGNIFTTKSLDRETISSYFLEIIAKDKGKPSQESLPLSLQVKVMDDNDNKPVFLKYQYNATISEGVTIGDDVIEVQAKDADIGSNGDVIYSILSGNDEKKFAIDNNTGVVTVAAQLDRETVSQYNLTIQGSDKGTSPKSSTTFLFIVITDINDFTPLFTNLTNPSVYENEPDKTLVTTVQATDRDIGENARLKYSLKANDAFTIDSTNGEIKTLKMLDREEKDNYNLELTVTDHGNPPLSSTKILNVRILDKDDNCPIFSQKVYNVTIMENLSKGTIILNVTATDKDIGNNARREYAIKKGDDRGAFVIDSITGTITVGDSSKVNYEHLPVYHLILRAGKDDCGLKAENATNIGEGDRDLYNNQSRSSVYIHLIDINDNPPKFISAPYHINYDDVQTTKIVDIQANDPDTGDGGQVEFQKIETKRVVQAITGKVRSEIGVLAYDKGIPRMNSTTTVIVNNDIPCDAMSFSVYQNGSVMVSTLCNFHTTPVKETKLLVGERLALECKATGNKQILYSWNKDGKNFADWSPNGTLIVPSVSQDEEGRYECKVNNVAGSLQSGPAMVLVYEKPKVITHPKEASAELKGTASFTCEATGDPIPTYQWYRNGIVFDAGNGARTTTLTLEDIGDYDAGKYHCVVENEKGSDESRKAELRVFDPNTVVEIKATINKPNENKSCHYFTKDEFEKLISKSSGSSVSVTKIDTSQLCKPSPCGPNPCLNEGKCEVVSQTALCSCKDAWKGDRCQEDVNECNNPEGRCQNNGTCINKQGYYTCGCPSTWIGRFCQLRKEACKPNPCKGDEMCVNVAASINSSGHSCVAKSKEMTVTIKGSKAGSGLTPEMRIKLLAQLNAMLRKMGNKPSRRFRRDTVTSGSTGDLSNCQPQITGVTTDANGDLKVTWVVVCPDSVKKNATDSVKSDDMCKDLLQGSNSIKGCGSTGKPQTTAAPDKTLPSLNVSIEVVVKDKNTGKAVSSKEAINIIKETDTVAKLGKEGIVIPEMKQATKPTTETAEKQSAVGAGVIAGAVGGIVVLIVVGVLALVIIRKRNMSNGKLMSVTERGAMHRKRSTEDLLRADISMSSINTLGAPDTPKSKHSTSDRDTIAVGDETFIFTVPDKVRKDKPSDAIENFAWYKGQLQTEEAEKHFEHCDKPGSYFVYKTSNNNIYLTVKCPKRPSIRHLQVNKTSEGTYIAQFGDLQAFRCDKFENIIEHFRVTPITFDEKSPLHVYLTEPWLDTPE